MSETHPTLAPADDARAQLYALGWWLQSRAWDREVDVVATAREAKSRCEAICGTDAQWQEQYLRRIIGDPSRGVSIGPDKGYEQVT